jgi:hypothetical protein
MWGPHVSNSTDSSFIHSCIEPIHNKVEDLNQREKESAPGVCEFASDSGSHLAVGLVRQAQTPWRLLLLPSLFFSFFSMKLKVPLEAIKLSTSLNFKYF